MTHDDPDPQADTPAPHADALEIIAADHEAIRAQLAAFAAFDEQSSPGADRHALVARLGALLTAHGRIETEIFYPALARAAEAAPLADALADHREIETQLQRLAAADPQGDGFAERLAALAGAVQDHLAEEERTLLPQVGSLDLAELGERMSARRTELLAGGGED